eukprot:COSAG06_NODE_50784_length_316_cov_0.815668_1_plen_54_part_01
MAGADSDRACHTATNVDTVHVPTTFEQVSTIVVVEPILCGPGLALGETGLRVSA